MNEERNTMLILPVLLVTMTACRAEPWGPEKNEEMEVRMIDAPSPFSYEEVNVDVRGVEANISEAQSGEPLWITLQAQPGVYNLLELANGFDALIGEAQVPAGKLLQIRLLLGDGHSIKTIGGIKYPMKVAGSNTTALKLDVYETITTGSPFTLYLDFDAARSVVNHGNGTFSLTPVLRAFTSANTGTVAGQVSIPGPGIAVILESESAIYTAYADRHDGGFMLRGISRGNYTLKVYPADSDIPLIVPDITVSAGGTVDAGLLEFRT